MKKMFMVLVFVVGLCAIGFSDTKLIKEIDGVGLMTSSGDFTTNSTLDIYEKHIDNNKSLIFDLTISGTSIVSIRFQKCLEEDDFMDFQYAVVKYQAYKKIVCEYVKRNNELPPKMPIMIYNVNQQTVYTIFSYYKINDKSDIEFLLLAGYMIGQGNTPFYVALNDEQCKEILFVFAEFIKKYFD